MRLSSPFDALTRQQLAEASRAVEVFYCDDADSPMVDFDRPHLYIVRTGEFEIRDPEGRLVDRLAEGDQFGIPSLLSGKPAVNTLSVLTPGLIYRINQRVFQALRRDNSQFEVFYTEAYARRLALSDGRTYQGSLQQPIGRMPTRQPATIGATESVAEAAGTMRRRRVSSLMVVNERDQLVGILTDRDIRNRAVAESLPYSTPVAQVMTPDPKVIDEQQTLAQVLTFMISNQIHHVPIVASGGGIQGMITANDVVQTQLSHPVFLLGRMRKAARAEQLVSLSDDLGNLLLQLIRAGTPVQDIGTTFTEVTDTLTRRLIELSLEELGAPPIDFAWLAFGSQARREQAANSDQDNGLLLASEPDDGEREYFAQLATRVNRGLDECGFRLCPGDVMAKNPQWCVSRFQWLRYFRRWISTPEPKALMHASIFFDVRSIYGDPAHLQTLRRPVLELAADNQIFLALLTQNALRTRVPLGFFKQFVLDKDGEQRDTLDLKHTGLSPMVDVARIHSLAAGIEPINTLDRLEALSEREYLNRRDVASFKDSYEFIARLRFEHQVRCWQDGVAPNNYLSPAELSGLQQRQLKDAFAIIDQAQQSIRMRYTRGLL